MILLGAENEVLKDENAALAAELRERERDVDLLRSVFAEPSTCTSNNAPMDTSSSTNSILPSSFSLGSQQIPPSSSESSSCMTACRNDVWVGSFQYGARGSGEDASAPKEGGALKSLRSDDMALELPSMDDDFFQKMQVDLPMDGEEGWGTVTFTSIEVDIINAALAESLSDFEESEGGNTKRRRYSKPATEKGKEIEVGSDDEGYD